MSINISDELKHTFELASLRHKTRALRSPADWEKGSEILNHYKREATKQTHKYYAEYDTRVTGVLKRLIDKAGSKNRDLKHRLFGNDNFKKDLLMRDAHREVQHDHHRRMAGLESKETHALDALNTQVEQRDRLRDKPKKDFDRASDRRSAKTSHKTPRQTQRRR